MTLAFVLKLAFFVAVPTLLWLLRRSDHPLARKLLRNVGPRTDHATMNSAQLQTTARRFLFFGLAAGSAAALLFAMAQQSARSDEAQAATAVVVIILVIGAGLFLLNSAHFALMAFNRRASERRASARPGSAAPLRPQ